MIAATFEELIAKGLEQFSIDGVAQRAGVNKTSIYRRWRTKEHLIVDALTSRGPMDTDPPPDTGSLRGDLLAYALSGLPGMDSPGAIAIARAFNASADPAIAEVRKAVWQGRRRAITQIVTRARKRGELTSAADAELLLDLIAGAVQFRQLVAEKPITPAYLTKITDAALRGIAPTSK